jgi:hypothetical protein
MNLMYVQIDMHNLVRQMGASIGMLEQHYSKMTATMASNRLARSSRFWTFVKSFLEDIDRFLMTSIRNNENFEMIPRLDKFLAKP